MGSEREREQGKITARSGTGCQFEQLLTLRIKDGRAVPTKKEFRPHPTKGLICVILGARNDI